MILSQAGRRDALGGAPWWVVVALCCAVLAAIYEARTGAVRVSSISSPSSETFKVPCTLPWYEKKLAQRAWAARDAVRSSRPVVVPPTPVKSARTRGTTAGAPRGGVVWKTYRLATLPLRLVTRTVRYVVGTAWWTVHVATLPLQYVLGAIYTVMVRWPWRLLVSWSDVLFHLYVFIGVAAIVGTAIGFLAMLCLRLEHLVYVARAPRQPQVAVAPR